ncbi:helix-turn-helix transcriptional regulator [Streptomyces sp. G45]|uniref:helix-turn-helix transcriptional regulator n=1 Tax=Streptomyces sp. G45 TaxID=3406627 RepID=UPI003C1F5A7A
MERRTLLSDDDLYLADVRCEGAPHGWTAPRPAAVFGLVLVRTGVVRARVDGVEQVMDPTTVFVERPGGEQQFAHPHGGDRYTEIVVSAPALADLLGGDPTVPQGLVRATPEAALAHRRLLAAADPFERAERTALFTGAALAQLAPARVAHGVPAAPAARRRLADAAREALAADARLSLGDLARLLHCSPYHLSRVFHAVTGTTLARHRGQLRTAAALDRLLAGDTELAALAADLGFTDQAHMTRVLRAHTGLAPGRLRALLGGPGAGRARRG